MATIAEQLASMPVIDALSRTENPLKSSWLKWPWNFEIGAVEVPGWHALVAFSEGVEATNVAGAYWNGAEYSGGRLGASFKLNGGFPAERYIRLWAAANPTSHSGYSVKAICKLEASNIFKIILEKWVNGAVETLAEVKEVEVNYTGGSLGLVVYQGRVSVWRITKEGGAWTEVVGAVDSSFTEGRAGIAAGGNNIRLLNFKAGNLAAGGVPATVNVLSPGGGVVAANRWILSADGLVNA